MFLELDAIVPEALQQESWLGCPAPYFTAEKIVERLRRKEIAYLQPNAQIYRANHGGKHLAGERLSSPNCCLSLRWSSRSRRRGLPYQQGSLASR